MNFKATAGLLGCLFFLAPDRPVAAAVLEDESNPYAIISERNVFHLNPIPPPPEPEAPKQELPEIKLSGFLRIGNTTHALFSSVSKDKKDGPKYFNLANGEKKDILEVVKIHDDTGEVDIINSGTPLTLSLKKDSLEPTAAPSNPAAPANSGPGRFPRLTGAGRHEPGQPRDWVPVTGQNGSPPYSMPDRRSRVQQ